MEKVTLSKAVRQNLHAMQSTAKLMSTTQNRLATGKKVNSAIDNPTNFFTASALNSRAGDLNNLMDSVGNAVQTLEAADNGVKAIQKLVESAQGTARQALQAAKGDITLAAIPTGTVLDVDGLGLGAGTADTDIAAIASAAFEITVTVNGVDTAVTGTGDESMNEMAALISDVEGITATVVEDATAGSFSLAITASDDVASFELADTTGTVADTLGIEAASSARSVDTKSETRATLEAQFNDLMVQIDQLSADASFNGNNFLDGDSLKVTFNESGTSSLTIKGADASSSGLGLSAITADAFQTNENIEATLKTLDGASGSLRSMASTFGSNLSTVQTRQDFTSSMIDTLESGAANLTLADLNQEGANMLALQTRQQLATTALSMAAQADQSVLRLL